MKHGFSFIEFLVVMSCILIMGILAVPFLSNFILRNNLDITVDEIVGTIRKAQSYALDGRNGQIWGVCLNNAKITLFSGTCASPSFSESFSVSPNITIANFNETTFLKFRGEPSAEINITVSTPLQSRTIHMNEAGGLEVE